MKKSMIIQVVLEEGELEKFMRNRGIKLTAKELSEKSGLTLEFIEGAFAGSSVFVYETALKLCYALLFPVPALFAYSFQWPAS